MNLNSMREIIMGQLHAKSTPKPPTPPPVQNPIFETPIPNLIPLEGIPSPGHSPRLPVSESDKQGEDTIFEISQEITPRQMSPELQEEPSQTFGLPGPNSVIVGEMMNRTKSEPLTNTLNETQNDMDPVFQKMLEDHKRITAELEDETRKKSELMRDGRRKREDKDVQFAKRKKQDSEDSFAFGQKLELDKLKKMVAHKEKEVQSMKPMPKEEAREMITMEKVVMIKEEMTSLAEKVKTQLERQHAIDDDIALERKALNALSIKKLDFEMEKRKLQSKMKALNDQISSCEKDELIQINRIKAHEKDIEDLKTEAMRNKLKFESHQYDLTQWELTKNKLEPMETLHNTFGSDFLFTMIKLDNHLLSEFSMGHAPVKLVISNTPFYNANGREPIKPESAPVIDIDATDQTILPDPIPIRYAKALGEFWSKGSDPRYFENYTELEKKALADEHDIESLIGFAFATMRGDADKGYQEALAILSGGLERNRHSEELWILYLSLYTSKWNKEMDRKEAKKLLSIGCKFCPDSVELRFLWESFEVEIEGKIVVMDKAIETLKNSTTCLRKSEFIALFCLERARLYCLKGDLRSAVELLELVPDLEIEHRVNLSLVSIAIQYYNGFPTLLEGILLLKYVRNPVGIRWISTGITLQDFSSLFNGALLRFASYPSAILQLRLNMISYYKSLLPLTNCIIEVESIVKTNTNVLEYWIEYLKLKEKQDLSIVTDMWGTQLKVNRTSTLLWVHWALFCRRHGRALENLPENQTFQKDPLLYCIWRIILKPSVTYFDFSITKLAGKDVALLWRELIASVNGSKHMKDVMTKFKAIPVHAYFSHPIFDNLESTLPIYAVVPKYLDYEMINRILLDFNLILPEFLDYNAEYMKHILESNASHQLLKKARQEFPTFKFNKKIV